MYNPQHMGCMLGRPSASKPERKKIASLEAKYQPDAVDEPVHRSIQEPHKIEKTDVYESMAPQECKPYTDPKLPIGTAANQH